MYSRILVPTDRSDVALEAVHWAERLAARSRAELFLLEVVQPLAGMFAPRPSPSLLTAARHEEQREVRAATEALSNQLHALHSRGLNSSRYVEVGIPVLRILEFIHEHDIDLVVMGTHGRGGLPRAILGSVADEVRRRASIPVLLVPRQSPVPLGEPSVLICLDNSIEAESALDAGLQLAADLGAGAQLFEVTVGLHEPLIAPSYLQRKARQAGGYSVPAACVIGEGDPGPAILLQAKVTQATVIAIASHGRSGVARAFLGSVASYVLSHSHVPVLLTHRLAAATQPGATEGQGRAVTGILGR